MSITIKSFKNYKKIAREVKKVFKQQLQVRPYSIIGMEWKDEFLKVTNNLKKLLKFDWSNAYIFPLATYVEEQKNQLDKELVENFIQKINIPPSNYEDIHKLAIKYFSDNNPNDLFLFDSQGGVDLLVFFIDSRGNFVFNDYESKKTYLNKANNGFDLISIGLKSILNAKKIICFCTEEASKDVIFKLNRKFVDVDDTLTYLHLHNDVTLYTLTSIINKHEINHEPMTQDKFQFIREIDSVDDNIDLSIIDGKLKNKDKNDGPIGIENINLDEFNKNMSNLDEPLLEVLQEDSEAETEVDEALEEEKEEEVEIQNQIEENIFNINETANMLKDQVYETENSIENVETIIDNLEQSVEEFEEINLNYLEGVEDYISNFIYLDPSEFDFSVSTKNADKKNEEDLIRKLNHLKEEIAKIEKEKQLILEKSEKEKLELEKELEQEEEFEELATELDFDQDLETFDFISDLEAEKGLEEEPMFKVEEKPKTEIVINIPENVDDIYKYLKIKSETLNHIEKMLLNNKLAKMKSDLIQKYNEVNATNIDKKIAKHNVNKFIKDNKHIIDKKNPDIEKYKLRYISGFRPTPMLMVWHDINKNFYLDLVKEMKSNFAISFNNNVFDEQCVHVWNDGCYLIYDRSSNMIRALAFSSTDRLVYLLRYVNKNLSMVISNNEVANVLSNLFIDKKSEIKVERI